MAKSQNAAGSARRRSVLRNIAVKPGRNDAPVKTPSANWKRIFLAALAETSNVRKSADVAVVTPSRAYKHRRKNPEFAKQWQAALSEGYDHLEMEVLRRLREGDFQTGDGTKFDFATASRILAAHRDAVGRIRAAQTIRSEEDVLAALNVRLNAIKQRDREIRANAQVGADTATKASDAQ